MKTQYAQKYARQGQPLSVKKMALSLLTPLVVSIAVSVFIPALMKGFDLPTVKPIPLISVTFVFNAPRKAFCLHVLKHAPVAHALLAI